jgi:DNA-binding HxlR family transcriptional regulator
MVATKPDSDNPVQACPIGPVVDIVFSRWTTPILWALHEFGVQRFVEIERRLGTITSKVLTQRLRQLERDGLVRRHYYAEIPPRVEYEITDLGKSLSPVFAALSEWSTANLPTVEAARAAYSGPLPRLSLGDPWVISAIGAVWASEGNSTDRINPLISVSSTTFARPRIASPS